MFEVLGKCDGMPKGSKRLPISRTKGAILSLTQLREWWGTVFAVNLRGKQRVKSPSPLIQGKADCKVRQPYFANPR